MDSLWNRKSQETGAHIHFIQYSITYEILTVFDLVKLINEIEMLIKLFSFLKKIYIVILLFAQYSVYY